MPNASSIFGRKIRNVASAQGITGSELARRLGVAHQNVQAYFKGTMPQSKTLVEIADVLNCDIRWLLDDDDERVFEVVWRLNKDGFTVQAKLINPTQHGG